MAVLSCLVAALITAVSGYTLSHSAQSIPKLRRYESQAEKAAEWSQTAERRLADTRYTVATGFVMTLVSLLSALHVLLLASPDGPSLWAALWAGSLGLGERWAAQYMHAFWADKKPVPLMDDYNTAIADTVNVIGMSDLLATGWAAVAVLRVLGL